MAELLCMGEPMLEFNQLRRYGYVYVSHRCVLLHSGQTDLSAPFGKPKDVGDFQLP